MSRSLVLLLLLSGCHKKPTEGGVRIEDVKSAFASGGMKSTDLVATDPTHMSATKCVAGTLSGVDAILCEYGSAEAVVAGKKAAEAWVATAVTGVALGNGRTVLGLADRTRSDPKGKTIHELSKRYLATQ